MRPAALLVVVAAAGVVAAAAWSLPWSALGVEPAGARLSPSSLSSVCCATVGSRRVRVPAPPASSSSSSLSSLHVAGAWGLRYNGRAAANGRLCGGPTGEEPESADDAYAMAEELWAWMQEEATGSAQWHTHFDAVLRWLTLAAADDHPDALSRLAALALVCAFATTQRLHRVL
jgi:hypothetical protein